MKEPAPRPRRTRLTRRSTRRSGYAFSHAHGYGDLVTSGRFLRRRVPVLPARSMGLIPTGRSPGFKPTGRSAGYSPVGREQNPKQKVEPTSLQMFRAVKDFSFWGCSFSTRARTKTLKAVYRVWTLGDIFTAAVLCVYSRILYTILYTHTKNKRLDSEMYEMLLRSDTFVTQNGSVVYSKNKLKYPSCWRTESIYLSFLLSSLQRERQTNLTAREQKQWHVHDIIEEVMRNLIQNTVSCSFPLPGTDH